MTRGPVYRRECTHTAGSAAETEGGWPISITLAVGAHLRTRRGSPVPAGVLAVVALVALVLRAATA